jgi:hypothetical protein
MTNAAAAHLGAAALADRPLPTSEHDEARLRRLGRAASSECEISGSQAPAQNAESGLSLCPLGSAVAPAPPVIGCTPSLDKALGRGSVLVLERDLEANPVGLDLTVVDHHVLL